MEKHNCTALLQKLSGGKFTTVRLDDGGAALQWPSRKRVTCDRQSRYVIHKRSAPSRPVREQALWSSLTPPNDHQLTKLVRPLCRVREEHK